MVAFQTQIVTVNKPDTGRDIDMKMKTLPKINYISNS
jgi:hypothetical protein